MYNHYIITKTNLELGLGDVDSQDLEELDKLQVVYSAVTNGDAYSDYVVFILTSTNLLRSNMLKASFISWICSSVNWSATFVMLSSSCYPFFLFYFPDKHSVLCVRVSKAPRSM